MGISVSGATAIIAIGLIMSIILVTTVFLESYNDIKDAEEIHYDDLLMKGRSAITIRNCSYHNGSGHLEINVSNTGDEMLDVSGIDVTLNGQLRTQNITSVTVNGFETGLWPPETSLFVRMNVSGALLITRSDVLSGAVRVKIICDKGISAHTTQITWYE